MLPSASQLHAPRARTCLGAGGAARDVRGGTADVCPGGRRHQPTPGRRVFDQQDAQAVRHAGYGPRSSMVCLKVEASPWERAWSDPLPVRRAFNMLTTALLHPSKPTVEDVERALDGLVLRIERVTRMTLVGAIFASPTNPRSFRPWRMRKRPRGNRGWTPCSVTHHHRHCSSRHHDVPDSVAPST